jgi:MoaA/NifB/PqqE/SkfB family radical SAM enzyme
MNSGNREQYYIDLIKAQPEKHRNIYDYAVFLKKAGRYDAAIKELAAALRLSPEDEEYNIEMGLLLKHTGAVEAAMEHYSRMESMRNFQDDVYLRNLVLNEKEYLLKKTVLNSFPRELGITLTNRCNIHCRMCELHDYEWEMSPEKVKELVSFFPYLEKIQWTGGEVFTSKYFSSLFDEAAKYPHIRQSILTNGLLIDKDWSERIIKSNTNALIYSIDGFNKEDYEYIRKGAEFERLIASIENVNAARGRYLRRTGNEANIKFSFIFVLMKFNYHEFLNAARFAASYRFDGITLFPVHGLGEDENGNFTDLSVENDEKALKEIRENIPGFLDILQKNGIEIDNRIPYLNLNPKDSDSEKEPPNEESLPAVKGEPVPARCYGPWQKLLILPGGNILPGDHCAVPVGNIKELGLKELWNSEKIQLYRKQLLSGDLSGLCDPYFRCKDINNPDQL